MNYYDAETVLSNTCSLLKLCDEYDEDHELREAILTLIPGFEYPDWSHKTVGEIYAYVTRPRRLTTCAHCMDDDFLDDIIAHGIKIVDDSQAPWRVTFEGTAGALREMYADRWGGEFPGFDEVAP